MNIKTTRQRKSVRLLCYEANVLGDRLERVSSQLGKKLKQLRKRMEKEGYPLAGVDIPSERNVDVCERLLPLNISLQRMHCAIVEHDENKKS